MSRKRKSDQEPTTETSTAIAEPPVADLATAVAEPPAEPIPQATFADRVGPKKEWVPAPDPFPIATDKLAGVRLFDSKQDGQVAIKFGNGSPEQKPSQAVLDRMKEAGYRWKPADRIWAHPYNGTAMRTRIESEQLYQEVCQMIRQEKGIESTQDIPF